MNSPGVSMLRSTCDSAAKFTTWSQPFIAFATASGLRMSPCTNVSRLAGMPSRFSRRPAYVSASRTTACAPGCLASSRCTKLEPMNPAPPVTSTRARERFSRSAILATPVVRDRRVVRGYPVLVGVLVVVVVRGHVHEVRRLHTDALHAVEHERRDHQQRRVLLAQEELVHLALRRAVLARVVQHHLGHALHDHEVIRLLLVVVPALHHLGVDDGQVDLAEPLEERVVVAEHLHEPTALIGNDLQRLREDAMDHALAARRLATTRLRALSPGRPLPTPTCVHPAAS